MWRQVLFAVSCDDLVSLVFQSFMFSYLLTSVYSNLPGGVGGSLTINYYYSGIQRESFRCVHWWHHWPCFVHWSRCSWRSTRCSKDLSEDSDIGWWCCVPRLRCFSSLHGGRLSWQRCHPMLQITHHLCYHAMEGQEGRGTSNGFSGGAIVERGHVCT